MFQEVAIDGPHANPFDAGVGRLCCPRRRLLGFSVWNLNRIQRSEFVEAAYQRDLAHVLKFAEKKSWHQAVESGYAAAESVPDPDEDRGVIKAKLEEMLSTHPEYAYALLYDKKNNLLVSVAQPGRDQDREFCVITQDAINAVSTWIPLEAKQMGGHVRAMAEKDEEPVASTADGHEGSGKTRTVAWPICPPNTAKDRVTLGVLGFDRTICATHFFRL